MIIKFTKSLQFIDTHYVQVWFQSYVAYLQVQFPSIPSRLKNKFYLPEVHRSMNATGHVQSKWRPKGVMLTLHMTRCVHTLMNLRKMKFISYIYTLFSLSFLFIICEVLIEILLNKRWRKVINRRVWLLCSTAVSLTWRQSNVTSASQLLYLSVTSLMHKVAWTSVVHLCMNLVGPQ